MLVSSPQVIEGCSGFSPEPSFLQPKQTQIPQPVFKGGEVLQTPSCYLLPFHVISSLSHLVLCTVAVSCPVVSLSWFSFPPFAQLPACNTPLPSLPVQKLSVFFHSTISLLTTHSYGFSSVLFGNF